MVVIYNFKEIKIRGGLKQARGVVASNDPQEDSNFKLSFGIGIPLEIWKKQNMQLDYALDPGNIGEGLSHLFSLSMEIK